MTNSPTTTAAPRRRDEDHGGEGTAHTLATGTDTTRAASNQAPDPSAPAEYITGEHLAIYVSTAHPEDRLDEALDLDTARNIWTWCHKYDLGKPETLAEVPVIPVSMVEHYLGDVPTRGEVLMFTEGSLDPTDPHDTAARLKAERAERVQTKRERHRELAELERHGSRGTAQRPASLSDELLTPTRLAELPRPTPLIDGLLYRDTLAQLAGEPGTGKTFAALNMACAVATRTGSLGGQHKVPEALPVLYVAAEGTSGLFDRIAAWCAHNNVDRTRLDGHLHVLPRPVQLGEQEQVVDLILAARRVSAGLVVLDTRARCTVGLEENSATDMGRAIDAAEQVRQLSGGATVMVVHHSAKGSGAPRGSTAWDGALWTDLRLTSDGDGDARDVTITCHKHKDVPDGCDHVFRLSPQPVPAQPGSVDPPRGSLVLTAPDPFAQPEPPENHGRVLDALADADASGGMTVRQIHDELKQAGHGMAQQTVRNRLKAAVAAGEVVKGGPRNAPKYTLAGAD